MVEVIGLRFNIYEGYVEDNKVYLNPDNIESVKTDKSDKDTIYIHMISGDIITSNRKALSDIAERFYWKEG